MSRYTMHPVWLTFADDAEERAWWRDVSLESRRSVRNAVLALVVVFSAFVVNDILVFRAYLGVLEAIRFGVVVPLTLFSWWWTGTDAGRRFLDRWMQEYLLGLALLAGGALLVMSVFMVGTATAEQVWFATPGFALALTCIYGLSRLRFVYASVVGILVTIGASALLAFVPAGGVSAVQLLPFAVAANLAGVWISRTLELLGRQEFAERRMLADARARSDALLHNVLPAAIAARLRDTDRRETIAERFDDVTVVLADVVGFTPMCERLPMEELGRLLEDLHDAYDHLCEAHGVEKIKTLGDAWLAAVRGDPAPAARFALALARMGEARGLTLRIGMHAGTAVGGVVGRTRFAWDLWGDAVRGATAMERGGRPGGIRVSPSLASRLRGEFQTFEEGGGVWLAPVPRSADGLTTTGP